MLANYNSKSILLNTLNIIFNCSVNIFAILTGFLYISKNQIRNKSIINLLVTAFFWCLCIFVCLKIYCPSIFTSIKIYIAALFPPLIGRYWYLTCYVFLFFCIPYLNFFINLIDKKNMQKFLIILFFYFSLVSTFLHTDFFRIENGYSPFWLIYCYCIGAYINIEKVEIDFKSKIILLICTIIGLLVANEVMFIFLNKFLNINNHHIFTTYNSPFILGESILFFMIFMHLKVKNGILQKILNVFSNSSFEVYIIHGNYLIYDFFITNGFRFLSNYNLFIVAILILLIIFGIYFGCTILSIVRKKLFSIFKIDRLCNYVGNLFDVLL